MHTYIHSYTEAFNVFMILFVEWTLIIHIHHLHPYSHIHTWWICVYSIVNVVVVYQGPLSEVASLCESVDYLAQARGWWIRAGLVAVRHQYLHGPAVDDVEELPCIAWTIFIRYFIVYVSMYIPYYNNKLVTLTKDYFAHCKGLYLRLLLQCGELLIGEVGKGGDGGEKVLRAHSHGSSPRCGWRNLILRRVLVLSVK